MESRNPDALKEELERRYQLAIKQEKNLVTIEVAEGENFLPRLFNELDTKIDSVELREPTLDDVFLNLTGRKIREEGASEQDRARAFQRARSHH